MSSTRSTTPENSISSIRKEGGSSTEVLELGRRLVETFDERDILGHWMARHLAEIIVSASDEATATLEQREAVVKTILLVWEHRRTFPGRRPMQAFDNVLSALDRLGDPAPWRLFTLFDDDLPIEKSPRSTLLATMGDLERHTRDAMLTLLWLAAQEARGIEHEWHDASDRVVLNIETDVYDRLASMAGYRRLRLRGLDLTSGPESSVDPSPAFDRDAADDVLDGQDEARRVEPSILAARLREMAKVLLEVADGVESPDSP